MRDKKKRKIEEQLSKVEKHLANAQNYISKNVNVESSSFLHFSDWRGQSGHPAWMRNFMMPTVMKYRARKEKALRTLDAKAKGKKLTGRKRQGWRKAAATMHRAGDDQMLIPDVSIDYSELDPW